VNNLNDDTNILLANECLGTDSLSGITNAGVARDAHLARMEHAISDFQSPEAFEAVHNNYDSIYPKMSNAADRCAHHYSIILFSAVVFLFFAIATLKRRGRIFVRIQFNSLVKKEERSLLRTYIYTHT